jgi:hypothetical protein
VIGFLREVSAAPIPASVIRAINRWQSHGSEARLERVGLLRMTSPDAMNQLAESPIARRLLGERIGPTAVIVATEDWPKLGEALATLSILPDVDA